MLKNRGEQFLHKREPRLHTSFKVEKTSQHASRIIGENIQKPADKLSAWLSHIEKTHIGHEPDSRQMDQVRKHYHGTLLVKEENIPQAYWNSQAQTMVDEGRGADLEYAGITKREYTDTKGKPRTDYIFSDKIKQQHTEMLLAEQKESLNNWLGYLTSPDSSSYPMWSKYWAFTGMTKLGVYDKEKSRFKKRRKDTVASFPDLNREALALVVDAIVKKTESQQIPQDIDDRRFKQLLDSANFGKLYAWALEKTKPTQESELAQTNGEWIKYDQGDDYMPLVTSIQGHNTGWCTAGETTAQNQLQNGDFYVYYSYDQDNQPTVPRIAIRMEQDKIAEIRGIAPNQNMDEHVSNTSILQDKLKEFGTEGKKYEKKNQDMQQLTAIQQAYDSHNQQWLRELTPQELIFLYEINQHIDGFGYQTDPRIEKLRQARDAEEDAPVVFECEPNQIAHSQVEVNETTKAYIGPPFPDIFHKLQQLEHIYTEFPEGKIRRHSVEIGGQTISQLREAFKGGDFQVSTSANSMMASPDFITAEQTEELSLIELKVGDLGFDHSPTTDEIYDKIEEFGLELCPAETGPHFRLQYTDQPQGERLRVGMKQIADSDGLPDVFDVAANGGGLWLHGDWTMPDLQWGHGTRFVFRFRK
ncbi:MAG: hypothetical protein ABIH87_04865 [bacterium]